MKIARLKIAWWMQLPFGLALISSSLTVHAQKAKEEREKLQLYTRIFEVQPDFLNLHGAPYARPKNEDPFAEEDEDNLEQLSPRKAAQDVLTDAGIKFPEGASVFYGAPTSQLIVRNTAENLDSIYTFLESAGYLASSPTKADDKGLRAIVELIEINQNVAATLLHQQIKSSNADELRGILDEKIKEGKASISHSSFLRTRLGKSKVESSSAHQHPKKWSSPNSSKDRSKTPYSTHRAPLQFDTTELGLTVELNTAPHGEEEGEPAGIEWTITNTKLLDKIGYGAGVSEIEKPLFYRQKIVTEVPRKSGQWQLLGTFTPAQTEDDSRTLVLVRTESGAKTAHSSSPDDTTNVAPQIGALMDYIEVDAADATNFTRKHSSVDGAQFLESATAWVNEGKASRIETVYLCSQQGDGYASGSVQSIREIVYPTEWRSPDIIGSEITGVIPDNANLVVPTTPTKFETQLVGTILDVQPTRRLIAGGNVTIRSELKTLTGFDSYGREESEVKRPLISKLEVATQERSMKDLQTGRTELLSMQIPIDPETNAHDTTRRILVFLTTAAQRP